MQTPLKDRIQHAVEKGILSRRSYYNAIKLPDEQKLGAPAAEEKLAQLEAKLEKQLPPSYRQFLELYDGWRMAFGGVDLLSVEEMLSGSRADRVAKWQPEAAAAGDAVAARSLVIGFSEATSIKLLLDLDRTDENGEWEMVGHDGGAEWTLQSFIDWLEKSAIDFRELAQEEIEGSE